MKFIKKIGILTFTIISFFSLLNVGCCGLYTNPTDRVVHVTTGYSPEIDGKEIEKVEEGGETFTRKLQGILRLPQKGEYTTSLGYVTSLIQVLINWLLGILAFIALVYMLYCGFLVFSSGSDDKKSAKGKKGISTAAIALAGIGLSWLIISAMIRFINLISSN